MSWKGLREWFETGSIEVFLSFDRHVWHSVLSLCIPTAYVVNVVEREEEVQVTLRLCRGAERVGITINLEVHQMLAAAGIIEPECSKLAGLSHCSAEFVRAWLDARSYNNDHADRHGTEKWGLGLVVSKLRKGVNPPGYKR